MGRFVFLLVVGLGGTAVLVWLGLWQLDRLAWKEEVIARIEAAIAAPPVPLEAAEGVQYEAVTARGTLEGPTLRFVHSGQEELVVTGLRTDTGLVLVDLGLAPARAALTLPEGPVTVLGNIDLPEGSGAPLDPDGVNAPPARDLATMAALFGSAPVLIAVQQTDPAIPSVTPLPVGTEDIPNNHLGYAVQWFGLALVWAGMSVFLAVRTRNQTGGET